jgi:hypothetical protein
MQVKQRIKRLEKLIRDRVEGKERPLPTLSFVDIVRVAEGEMEPTPEFNEAFRRWRVSLEGNESEDGG